MGYIEPLPNINNFLAPYSDQAQAKISSLLCAMLAGEVPIASKPQAHQHKHKQALSTGHGQHDPGGSTMSGSAT